MNQSKEVHMSTVSRAINPVASVSTGIGYYLGGMNEVREQLRDAVREISLEDVGRSAVPDTHSIGALVLHLAESEWFWLQCCVGGHELNEDDKQQPYWDVLFDRDRVRSRNYSAEFCLQQADHVREQTRATLAGLSDDDLERVFSFEWRNQTYEQTLRWILHHLIDHEAQHKGQILMLKRLLGLKNEEPFS